MHYRPPGYFGHTLKTSDVGSILILQVNISLFLIGYTANKYLFFFIFFDLILAFRLSIYDCDITKFNAVVSLILESDLGALLEYPLHLLNFALGDF